VTTSVSIDGGAPDLLDLRDYDHRFHQDGPETAASQVVWFMEDLRNATHTLNVSVGMSEDLAILDTLVCVVYQSSYQSLSDWLFIRYTALDPGDTNKTSMPHTMTNTRTLSVNPTSSLTPTNTSPPSSKTGLSITLGVVCTVFGSLVFWAIFWFWRRHRKRSAEEESAIHADSNPDMSEATTRPKYPRTTGLPAVYKGKRVGSNKRRGLAPLSPLRSNGAHRRTARKKLSTIPEMSGDQDVDEAFSSQNSSATTSASTSPDTSPSTSLKNNGPDDWTVPSSSPLTVRLVTDNNIS